MPYLCKMCKAEAEDVTCEVCGAPTTECDELYMISLLYTCTSCGSRKYKSIDSNSPDSLKEGHCKMLRCPSCDDYTMHEISTIGITKLPNYSSRLETLYSQELRKNA